MVKNAEKDSEKWWNADRENTFVYKLFLLLNISDFSLFFM